MPFDVFTLLRTHHPDQLAVIARIKGSLASVLHVDPDAVIDSRVMAAMTGIDESTLEAMLVELAGHGALSPRFFWICPTTGSEASEAETVEAFPLTLECGKCGLSHSFTVGDVEVGFLASTALIAVLFEGNQGRC